MSPDKQGDSVVLKRRSDEITKPFSKTSSVDDSLLEDENDKIGESKDAYVANIER
jgi:myo-inositol-1-phosphate synthase